MPIWKLLFLMATNVANMWERVNEKSVYKYELVVFNIGENDQVEFTDVENDQLIFIYWLLISRPNQLGISKITYYVNSSRYEVMTIFLLCWVGPPLLHI